MQELLGAWVKEQEFGNHWHNGHLFSFFEAEGKVFYTVATDDSGLIFFTTRLSDQRSVSVQVKSLDALHHGLVTSVMEMARTLLGQQHALVSELGQRWAEDFAEWRQYFADQPDVLGDGIETCRKAFPKTSFSPEWKREAL